GRRRNRRPSSAAFPCGPPWPVAGPQAAPCDATAGAPSARGHSLLPTTVRVIPVCSVTDLPPMSSVVLSLMFQPSEPVENSLGTAVYFLSPIWTSTGFAFWANSARVIGHDVFLAIAILLGR